MTFDTVTLYSVVTATAAIGALLLATLGRRSVELPGALTWAWGLALLATYFLLALVHLRLPAVVGVGLANGMAVAAMAVMHRGACQICERPFPRWLHVGAILGVTITIVAFFLDATTGYDARVMVVGVVTAAQCVLIARVMWPASAAVNRDEALGRRVGVLLFGSIAALQAARVLAHSPMLNTGEPGFLSTAMLSQVTAVVFLAWCLAVPVVVVYIHEARARQSLRTAVDDLTRALAEVKTLRDLLPICAACRRIRDDENHWSSLEVYLETHAGVQLTHGVCPECIKRLYPEYESMQG